ncbi:prolipoprotein diacylglyceryl transferase [Flavobacteriaceae bacterium GSB9]|nr:prolipoprotein diacylglyceryl transferase [Flavobacteriaceae bacterium GSB9]
MLFIVVYKSIKRSYHLRSVLLMFTTITLFTVIGTRLFTIPIEDWVNVINIKTPEFNNRSSIGGLLFGLMGLLISQRLFGFKRPMLDLFAWLVPIAIGIAKFGCLFNGCCYGLPFDSSLGIQYPVGTHAHFNHWFTNGIANDSILSLTVHPVQLYESLTLFVIGYVVWKTNNLWKKNLSAMLFALSLIFTLRFGVEFFRDHSVSQFSTAYYLGIWSYQWGMLILGLLLAVVLWFYEKRAKTEITKGRQNSPYIHAEFIYIVTLSVIIYTFRNLLNAFEFNVVWIMFVPGIILSLFYLFTDTRLRNQRKLIAVLLLAPFYVLAQTIPNQTSKIKQYNRIDIGSSLGNFINEVKFNPQETQNACGTSNTSYSTAHFKQVYQIAGAGYSQVTIEGNKTKTLGINLSGGNIKSTILETNDSQSEFIFAVNPYMKWDGKWIGGGLGLQLGKLHINKDETIDIGDVEDGPKDYYIRPEFYLRFGQRKYLDVDYNYGFMMPSAYPTLYSRSSIGSALGLSQDYSFRYGHIWNLDSDFVSAEALLTDQLGVNLMYVFKENNFSSLDDEASGKFVFSLNYRFGNKTK